MGFTDCCLKGFKWDGTPTGSTVTLGKNQAYKTGTNTQAAVMLVHDILGWTFPNTRLLADHYAEEANVTVYVPDFFGGEVLDFDIMLDRSRWGEIDFPGFLTRNLREVREGEIFECAQALRAQYARLGAVGFCYGGWACFRLGAGDSHAANDSSKPLLDCFAVAHPTFLTKEDISAVRAPTLVLAPHVDAAYTDELKLHTFQTLPANGVAFSYVNFPDMEHGFATRGSLKVEGERKAMAKAKRDAVNWFKEHLHDEE